MKNKLLVRKGLVMIFVVFLLFGKGFSQSETSKNGLINVRDYKAVGDGKTDDTQAIQASISGAEVGDTVFIPEGKYLVKALGLKSGVHIRTEGLLMQKLPGDREEFSPSKQNSSSPLFRGINVTDVSLSFRAQSVQTAAHQSLDQEMVRRHERDFSIETCSCKGADPLLFDALPEYFQDEIVAVTRLT